MSTSPQTTIPNWPESFGAGGQNGSGNICVAVRLRPLIEREVQAGSETCWVSDSNYLQQIDPDTGRKCRTAPHTFDNVFGGEQETKEIYKQVVSPIVNDAFSGFNGTILCYGQTSSGKTFTLYGSEEEEGIISLAAKELFERIRNDNSNSYIMKIGLLEIYNEKVSDLLTGNDVTISETGGNVVPKNLTEIQVLSPQDILENVKKVQNQRKIGETKMNKESSRSHTILRILMEISKTSEVDGADEIQVTNALLNFVDLAGSEKAGQTGAQGLTFKESTYINKSLSALAQVVMQLTTTTSNTTDSLLNTTTSTNLIASAPGTSKRHQPSRFINFRDSKLTHILKNSLNGNAYTTIICNVTPAALSVDETLSTLRFAKAAKTIKTSPKPNLVYLNNAESKQKIFDLQAALDRKQSEVDYLQKQLGVYQKRARIKTPPRVDTHVLVSGLSERRRTWHTTNRLVRSKSQNFLPNRTHLNSGAPDGEVFMNTEETLNHFQSLEMQRDAEACSDVTLVSKNDCVTSKDAEVQTNCNYFSEPEESPEPPRKKSKYSNQLPDSIMPPLEPETPPFVLRKFRDTLSDALFNQTQDINALKAFHFNELEIERSRIRELEELTKRLQDEKNEFIAQNNILKSTLDANNELKATDDFHLQELEQENKNLEQEIIDLEQENKNLEKGKKALESRLTELEWLTTTLQSEHEELYAGNQKFLSIEKELSEEKSKVCELESANQILQTQIKELDSVKTELLDCNEDFEELQDGALEEVRFVKEKLSILQEYFSVERKDCATSCDLITESNQAVKEFVDQSVQTQIEVTEVAKLNCGTQTDSKIDFSDHIKDLTERGQMLELRMWTEQQEYKGELEHRNALLIESRMLVDKKSNEVNELRESLHLLSEKTEEQALLRTVKESKEVQCDFAEFEQFEELPEESDVPLRVSLLPEQMTHELVNVATQIEILSSASSAQTDIDIDFTNCIKDLTEKNTILELRISKDREEFSKELDRRDALLNETKLLVDEKNDEVNTLGEALDSLRKVQEEQNMLKESKDSKEIQCDFADVETLCEQSIALKQDRQDVSLPPSEMAIELVDMAVQSDIVGIESAAQTDSEIDYTNYIKDLVENAKILEQRISKDRDVHIEELSRRDELLNEFKTLINEKSHEVNQLMENICEMKTEHEKILFKPKVTKEIQCEVVDVRGLSEECQDLKQKISQLEAQTIKDLSDKSIQIEDVKMTKLNRACQTEAGLDQTVRIRDLTRKAKLLELRSTKEQETHKEEVKRFDLATKESKKLLDERIEEINKLREVLNLMKKEKEEQLMLKPKDVKEIQCDYMTELIERSREGELGLLPKNFPDIGGLSAENKRLTQKVFILETKIAKNERSFSDQDSGSSYRNDYAKPSQQLSYLQSSKSRVPSRIFENRKSLSIIHPQPNANIIIKAPNIDVNSRTNSSLKDEMNMENVNNNINIQLPLNSEVNDKMQPPSATQTEDFADELERLIGMK